MVINEILAKKRKEIARLRPITAKGPQRSRVRDHAFRFYRTLQQKKAIHLICELKKASPSKGLLRKRFEPVSIAKQYERSGAAAISILTERHFFRGTPGIFRRVRRCTRLPLLRKDFVIDPRQIPESVELGADAVLLIASILRTSELRHLIRLCRRYGLDALVEVHNVAELKRAVRSGARIVGINNRNLKSLKVNKKHALRILPYVPKRMIVVVESGLASPADLIPYVRRGVHCFLIGTHFMVNTHIERQIKKLKDAAYATCQNLR